MQARTIRQKIDADHSCEVSFAPDVFDLYQLNPNKKGEFLQSNNVLTAADYRGYFDTRTQLSSEEQARTLKQVAAAFMNEINNRGDQLLREVYVSRIYKLDDSRYKVLYWDSSKGKTEILIKQFYAATAKSPVKNLRELTLSSPASYKNSYVSDQDKLEFANNVRNSAILTVKENAQAHQNFLAGKTYSKAERPIAPKIPEKESSITRDEYAIYIEELKAAKANYDGQYRRLSAEIDKIDSDLKRNDLPAELRDDLQKYLNYANKLINEIRGTGRIIDVHLKKASEAQGDYQQTVLRFTNSMHEVEYHKRLLLWSIYCIAADKFNKDMDATKDRDRQKTIETFTTIFSGKFPNDAGVEILFPIISIEETGKLESIDKIYERFSHISLEDLVAALQKSGYWNPLLNVGGFGSYSISKELQAFAAENANVVITQSFIIQQAKFRFVESVVNSIKQEKDAMTKLDGMERIGLANPVKKIDEEFQEAEKVIRERATKVPDAKTPATPVSSRASSSVGEIKVTRRKRQRQPSPPRVPQQATVLPSYASLQERIRRHDVLAEFKRRASVSSDAAETAYARGLANKKALDIHINLVQSLIDQIEQQNKKKGLLGRLEGKQPVFQFSSAIKKIDENNDTVKAVEILNDAAHEEKITALVAEIEQLSQSIQKDPLADEALNKINNQKDLLVVIANDALANLESEARATMVVVQKCLREGDQEVAKLSSQIDNLLLDEVGAKLLAADKQFFTEEKQKILQKITNFDPQLKIINDNLDQLVVLKSEGRGEFETAHDYLERIQIAKVYVEAINRAHQAIQNEISKSDSIVSEIVAVKEGIRQKREAVLIAASQVAEVASSPRNDGISRSPKLSASPPPQQAGFAADSEEIKVVPERSPCPVEVAIGDDKESSLAGSMRRIAPSANVVLPAPEAPGIFNRIGAFFSRNRFASLGAVTGAIFGALLGFVGGVILAGVTLGVASPLIPFMVVGCAMLGAGIAGTGGAFIGAAADNFDDMRVEMEERAERKRKAEHDDEQRVRLLDDDALNNRVQGGSHAGIMDKLGQAQQAWRDEFKKVGCDPAGAEEILDEYQKIAPTSVDVVAIRTTLLGLFNKNLLTYGSDAETQLKKDIERFDEMAAAVRNRRRVE